MINETCVLRLTIAKHKNQESCEFLNKHVSLTIRSFNRDDYNGVVVDVNKIFCILDKTTTIYVKYFLQPIEISNNDLLITKNNNDCVVNLQLVCCCFPFSTICRKMP